MVPHYAERKNMASSRCKLLHISNKKIILQKYWKLIKRTTLFCYFETKFDKSSFSSCFSYIGMQGGRQKVSLGEGCEHKGVAIHEMMHALGIIKWYTTKLHYIIAQKNINENPKTSLSYGSKGYEAYSKEQVLKV